MTTVPDDHAADHTPGCMPFVVPGALHTEPEAARHLEIPLEAA